MGQVWGCIEDRCRDVNREVNFAADTMAKFAFSLDSGVSHVYIGKQWKQAQLKKITDRVFDRFKDESGKVHMTFEELYIAVLLVFNDLNKHLPGPHIDPPTKVEFRAMMETFDLNLDGELDKEEFEAFIQKLAGDTLTLISQNLIIALVAAPTIALMTKRATEGVPGVGKVVQRLPSSVYASLVTLVVMMIQTAGEDVN